jgi:hypothetical protein
MANELDFGDYCQIEQKRYGVKNEMFTHKVISRSRSNSYVDVPVTIPVKNVLHDAIVDVVSCICCGVDETEVRKYRVGDVTPSSSQWAGQNKQ